MPETDPELRNLSRSADQTPLWKSIIALMMIAALAVAIGLFLFQLEEDETLKITRLLGYALIWIGGITFLTLKAKGDPIDLKFIKIPDHLIGTLILVIGCATVFLPEEVSARFGVKKSETPLEDRIEARFTRVLQSNQVLLPFNFTTELVGPGNSQPTGSTQNLGSCEIELLLIHRDDLPECLKDVWNISEQEMIQLLARYFREKIATQTTAGTQSFKEWANLTIAKPVETECDEDNLFYRFVERFVTGTGSAPKQTDALKKAGRAGKYQGYLLATQTAPSAQNAGNAPTGAGTQGLTSGVGVYGIFTLDVKRESLHKEVKINLREIVSYQDACVTL